MKRSFFFWLRAAILPLSLFWTGNAYARHPGNDEPAVSNPVTSESVETEAPAPFSFGFDSDFVSRYLWRCLIYTEGPAWQPSASVSKWGITPSVWASVPLSGGTNISTFNEVDLGVSYLRELGNFTLKPGFVYFLYPDLVSTSTGEVSLEASYAIHDVTVGVSQSVDIDEYRGAYFANVFAGYSRDIGESFHFNGTLSVSWASSKWNGAYFGVTQAALNHAALELSLTCDVWKSLYVRPHAQFATLTAPSLRDAVADPNPFVLGVALGASY